MFALTLKDYTNDSPTPWATLMEAGVKTLETRKWDIPRTVRHLLPFDLLITASKASKTDNAGRAVCVVKLFDSYVFNKEHEQEACCEVYPGFAWATKEVRWLSHKFFVKGQLGLFEIDIPPQVKIYTPSPEQLHSLRTDILVRYGE